MDSQEVGGLLEECVRAAAAPRCSQPTAAQRLDYRSCTGSLCAEVALLLQEATEMKWPFVPERWQYKQAVSASDKTNLSDLISKHLPELLAVLKASILAQEAGTALAAVFLVDRFLYWTDESSRLLEITRLLHRRHPDAPVAPQLVIRQARVYVNSGKLQKAEYILSSLINSSGATGCWAYHSESDRALVQAVSVQVRGMILQKLGLWLEAAGLIWASLAGYYALPQPDKKGIGTSLGILANILVSMDDEDFHTFRTNPDIDLSLLGNSSHRLLSAAQAAKMAVVYSQFTSLYVLTNAATQGTCLLSYSFSAACPASQRQRFLLQAREAFEIGLLTKSEGERASSKQELHTFLKAAYSLTVTHKWLGTCEGAVAQAAQACKKALGHFYDYCNANPEDKDGLCAEITHLVGQVKLLLQAEPFPNSDRGSFIPDSYRVLKDVPVSFTLEGFAKVMQRFHKSHASLCATSNTKCRGSKEETDGARLCITALATNPCTGNTERGSEACQASKDEPKGEQPHSSAAHPAPKCDTTVGSTDSLGSSWQNVSPGSWGSGSSTGSHVMKGEANRSSQSSVPTEVDDDAPGSSLHSAEENKKREFSGSGASSHPLPRSIPAATSFSCTSSDSEKFEAVQAGKETLSTGEEWVAEAVGVPLKQSPAAAVAPSLSQASVRTSSSSLGDSFSSHSSWDKMSADLNSLTTGKSSPGGKSADSDGSFFMVERLNSKSSDSAHSPTRGPFNSLSGDPAVKNGVGSVSVQAADWSVSPQPNPEQCASTEASTESSFERLEEGESEGSKVLRPEPASVPKEKNPSCSRCLKPSAAPERQYALSQEDFLALLAGVCHECLLERLHSDKTQFKVEKHRTAHSALHLKFSKGTGLWTARETCIYIGEPTGMQGKQRAALSVQFLHQEERLSSYVGKDYLKPKAVQFHLKDVERQMTAQYYVMEFNKSLYEKEVTAQMFFIPSEALLILDGSEIVGCVTVEPYMLGDFVKLTNNAGEKDKRFPATEYGLAFGHFTYLFSGRQEVVVDLQGWVTANGKGLTYLTDPQIHSTKTPEGPANFAARGLRRFLEEQHGPECNNICQLLKLPPVVAS